MRILQRNLKRTTDTFLFISHTTNVLLFKFRCNIFIGFRIIKEIVTVDPGSKPDQNLCSAERHAKIREKEFRLCTVHWYIVSVWTLRLLVLISWMCLSREGTRLAFSYGYNDTAALSPWEQYILRPFRHASVIQLWKLRNRGCEASTGCVWTS